VNRGTECKTLMFLCCPLFWVQAY